MINFQVSNWLIYCSLITDIYSEWGVRDLELSTEMPIRNDRKRIIFNCMVRLVSKNSNTLHLMGAALTGLLRGSFSKQMVSRVFDFDPKSELPVEDLVAESLLNSLEKEDIEEIFKRYARRKGLDF